MPTAFQFMLEPTPVELHEAIEKLLIINLPNCPEDMTSEMLYTMSKKQVGTGTLMDILIKKVSSDSVSASSQSAELICQSMVALNMAGVEVESAEFGLYAHYLAPRADELSLEERKVLD